MTEVRRATVADAAVLARLLWDFNTEFETETDDADVLAVRFARLLRARRDRRGAGRGRRRHAGGFAL